MKGLKLVILGISMFLTGFISFAILCGGSLASNYTKDGIINFLKSLELYGLTGVAIGFLVLGFVGFIIAIIGVFQKSE